MKFLIKMVIFLVLIALLFMFVAWCVSRFNGITWQEQFQEWFKISENSLNMGLKCSIFNKGVVLC